MLSKCFPLQKNKIEANVHDDEPRHPLSTVERHEYIQQELQKRVKHVEHGEEVKQRGANVEDTIESDRRHANGHASERVRDEQTGYQLRGFVGQN